MLGTRGGALGKLRGGAFEEGLGVEGRAEAKLLTSEWTQWMVNWFTLRKVNQVQ